MKKRTKRYLKKLNKTLKESNRYMSGIHDILLWAKMDTQRSYGFHEKAKSVNYIHETPEEFYSRNLKGEKL